MKKLDYKKELKHLYKPSSRKVEVVDVPEMNFLMIDTTGDPNSSSAFQEAVEALFSLAYATKFMFKKSGADLDYTVMPMEALVWVEDMTRFSVDNKKDWLWTLMIMQPPCVDEKLIHGAIEKLRSGKNPKALSDVRFESFTEGAAVQTLYIGPFADEGPTIQKLHEHIVESGHQLEGKHHEIYLSDFRRTAPEKLRTIIRQPMAR